MALPEPEISVQAFPLDGELAFYRLRISDPARLDALADLAERVQAALGPVTSEVKTNLAADGGSFIMAFLPDRRHMDIQAVRELVHQAAQDHVRHHQHQE